MMSHKPQIELLFLMAFFISLCIPILHISQKAISETENRTLAVFKPFVDKEGKIDFEFGKNFENYLKDRFFLREPLIHLYSNLIYQFSVFVFQNNGRFVMKDEKYIFKDCCVPKGKNKDIEIVGEYLQNFDRYLNSKGIKFYVVTLPTLSYLLREHNLIYLPTPPQNDYLSPKDLKKTLSQKYHINYIDMTDIFKEKLKEDLPVYKTEHHATDFGYFLTYIEFMNLIKRDLKDIPVRTIYDFNLSKNKLVRHNNDRSFHLGRDHDATALDERIIDNEYTYFDYKKSDNIKVQHDGRCHHLHTNPEGKYKILLISDSSGEGFVYFLDTSFAEVDFYRVNMTKSRFDVEPFYAVIDKFKPNAVVFLRDIAAFNDFKTMYPKGIKERK